MIATIVDDLHRLSFTDVLILVGIIGYLIERTADARGWSRTSKTLRRENEDLVRRNAELEQTVARHAELIASLQDEIRDLKRSDQAAVLAALKEHEVGAMERATETHRLLGESTVQLVRIATVLETTTT